MRPAVAYGNCWPKSRLSVTSCCIFIVNSTSAKRKPRSDVMAFLEQLIVKGLVTVQDAGDGVLQWT